MKLTEARVGIIALAFALVGQAIVLWADVRDNTTAIAQIEEEREEARKSIREFIREYDRRATEDEDNDKRVDRLENEVRELRLILAEQQGEH